jgi:hypothetical protein
MHGRQFAYGREMCIVICRRFLLGEDFQAICAKPPMPIAPIFLDWVQQHQEAREIYRSACNFKSDRKLAKEELHVPWPYSVGEWEKEVRARLELGYPVDYIDRKYILPDWNKVYLLIGGPPVWSTEDMQAYNALLGEFTEMLQPCDLMEPVWTKDAADATWELGREAREKNALPEQQYQWRLQNLAQIQRQARVEAKPATAFDHSLGLRAGFKYHQGLGVAQTRAIKRRDNALRQIARWRDGLGGKARALCDKFVAELALAERYGVAHSLDAEIDDTAGEAMKVPLPPPPRRAADEDAEAAPAVASSGEAAEAAPAKAAPPIASADGVAEAAPPRVRAGAIDMASPAEPINWVAWLKGAEEYDWVPLVEGARKKFKQPFGSKRALVRHLVVDRKLVRPDQVCRELAQLLPAIEAAAPVDASSGQAGDAVPPVAPSGETAEAAPTVVSSGEAAQAAPAKAARPSANEAAEAARPRAPTGEVDIDTDSPTEPINWVAWLTGAERYTRITLVMGAEKQFKQDFESKGAPVQMLVVDRKLVRPDQVCPELAQYLPAIGAATPTPTAPAEEPK